jgi:hypothetical protein
MLAEGIPGEVRGMPGGLHIFTFTQIAAFWPGGSVRRGPDSIPQVVQARPSFDERDSAYARPPALSTGGRSAGPVAELAACRADRAALSSSAADRGDAIPAGR